MKFKIANKEEILATLSEVEKQMCDIRFALTQLPQEFELEPVDDQEENSNDDRQ